MEDLPDTLDEELHIIEKGIRSATEQLANIAESDLSEIMFRAYRIMDSEKDQIAAALSGESGKPLRFALNEVDLVMRSALTFGEVISDSCTYMRERYEAGSFASISSRNPIGVVLGLISFTDPFLNAASVALPALITRNPVILKPSSRSPLSAMKLRDVLYRSGLPENFMRVIVGSRDSQPVKSLMKSRYPDAVAFYGSADSAHNVRQHLYGKIFVPHPGGGCVSIVWKDADLDMAGRIIAESSFHSQGQNAFRTQRVIVHPDVVEYLTGRLREEISQMIIGDPSNINTDIGPLSTPEYTEIFVSLIRMMFDHGDRLLEGGKIEGRTAPPTIVDASSPESPVWKDDVMAPVVSLITSDSIDSSIAIANGIGIRNTASVFTSNVNTSFYYFRKLKFREVVINDSPDFRYRVEHNKKSLPSYREKRIYDLMDEFSTMKSMSIR